MRSKNQLDEFVLKPHPPGRKGLCYRSNCIRPECREAYLRSQKTRLNLKIKEFPSEQEKPLFYLTLELADASAPTTTSTEIKKARELMSAVIKKLSDLARKEGIKLQYYYVFGAKSNRATSPGQLHLHGFLTWMPEDAKPDPTNRHPGRYTSETLNQIAKKLGLKAWLERANNYYAIAAYLVKNLKFLSEAEINGLIELPAGFRRVSCSQDWPKLEYQKKRRAKAQEKKRRMTIYSIKSLSRMIKAAAKLPMSHWHRTHQAYHEYLHQLDADIPMSASPWLTRHVISEHSQPRTNKQYSFIDSSRNPAFSSITIKNCAKEYVPMQKSQLLPFSGLFKQEIDPSLIYRLDYSFHGIENLSSRVFLKLFLEIGLYSPIYLQANTSTLISGDFADSQPFYQQAFKPFMPWVKQIVVWLIYIVRKYLKR